jgi:hypothetical protein
MDKIVIDEKYIIQKLNSAIESGKIDRNLSEEYFEAIKEMLLVEVPLGKDGAKPAGILTTGEMATIMFGDGASNGYDVIL